MSSARRSATDQSKTFHDQSTIRKLFRTIRKLFVRPSPVILRISYARSQSLVTTTSLVLEIFDHIDIYCARSRSNHNKSSPRSHTLTNPSHTTTTLIQAPCPTCPALPHRSYLDPTCPALPRRSNLEVLRP